MRRREHGTQGRRGPRRAAVAVLAAVGRAGRARRRGVPAAVGICVCGRAAGRPDAQTLALPDGALPEAASLGALGALTTLDLRGREDVTAAYVEAAQAALPAGCEVLWTVRLSDGAFDSDAETLTLRAARRRTRRCCRTSRA